MPEAYRIRDGLARIRRMSRRVAILGVPMDLGQGRRGVDMGPSAIRYGRLHERLESARLRRHRSRATSTCPAPRSSGSSTRKPGGGMGYLDAIRHRLRGDDREAPRAAGGDLPGRPRRRPLDRHGLGDRRFAPRAHRPRLGRRARRLQHRARPRPPATSTACRSATLCGVGDPRLVESRLAGARRSTRRTSC